MEQTINRVELMGRVGVDPKINSMEGGRQVIHFVLATNESYKTKSGEIREETTWHRISMWNNRGMPDFSKIKKGTLLKVAGRLRTQSYDDNDGQKHYSTEVVAISAAIVETEKIISLQFTNS